VTDYPRIGRRAGRMHKKGPTRAAAGPASRSIDLAASVHRKPTITATYVAFAGTPGKIDHHPHEVKKLVAQVALASTLLPPHFD
jgi:hypothetical protein